MQEIARAAGVSKPLLYHYFPSKVDLFKAAVAEKAAELQALITPGGGSDSFEELTRILDAYLGWIDANARTWSKLLRSAASLPEASALIESFRDQTMEMILGGVTAGRPASPALRTAIKGWLGYMDAAILDWIETRGQSREQLRDLLIAVFGASLAAAQQTDADSADA